MIVGFVAFVQAGHEIDDPGPAPAGMTATVTQATLQRGAHRLRQLRRGTNGNLPAGMQGKQVRHVAMSGLGFLVIDHPLLQLAVLADLQRRQFLHSGFESGAKFFVCVQNTCGFNTVAEQVVNDFKIHGGADAEHGLFAICGQKRILRRVRRIGDQVAVGRLYQKVEDKFRRAFHDRIRSGLQKSLIAGERVMLPDMLTQPGRTHGPDAPDAVSGCGESPDIAQMMHHPTAGAVMALRRQMAGFHQGLDVIHQRQSAVGQITHLGRPIVHLQIDVGVIIRIPRRRHRIVPFALQIGRQRSGPRTGHEQVTAVLKIERHERRIVGSLFHFLQPLVRRHVRLRRRAQIEGHAAKSLLMLTDMCRFQFSIRLSGGFYSRLTQRARIFVSIGGGGGHINGKGVGVANGDMIFISRHFTAFRRYQQQRLKSHTASAIHPSTHDQHVVAGRSCFGILAAREVNASVQMMFSAAGHPRHQHLIRRRNERFARKGHPVFFKAHG